MRKLLREKWRRIVFLILMSLCIIPDTDMQPILSPALALFAGIVVANTMGNPFEKLSREAVKTLLKIAIVGLGFGIHADKAMQAGGKGVLLTVFSIALTLTLGAFLGRKLTVDKKTSYLIASGTAICGGSAIAAVSPLVKADDSQISLALGTVFILNAAALFIFPPIGQALEMCIRDRAQALSEIAQFAFQQNLPYWGGIFQKALETLHSDHPEENHPMEKDIPCQNYPLIARQVIFSAFSSWVFGAMGSWNDLGFEDRQVEHTYDRLSENLYRITVQALLEGVNSY